MKLLTIAILSSNRFDLLQATINSLINTVTYPYWQLVVLNHNGTIGQGWNKLIDSVDGEYVLMCQDDWFFIEKWDWVQQAIDQLDHDPNAGIVRLRKENDGQNPEIVTGKDLLLRVDCIGGGFSMNPFICKNETIDKIGRCQNIQREKGVAEVELRSRYAGLGLNTYKLDNAAKGVCIHIGRGRRILGKET